jgi:hypothetical protein
MVRSIGKGYYGIATEGVTIGTDVHSSVQAAFERVSSIPTHKLNVSLNDTKTAEKGKVQAPKTASQAASE